LKEIWGQKALYEKARNILPDLEEWLQLFHPRGSGDIFFGRNMEPALKKRIDAAWNRAGRTILQNKMIVPEFAFLSRADHGMWFFLEQLGAVVNVSEISRRVEAGHHD
jgi:hypothetical protein